MKCQSHNIAHFFILLFLVIVFPCDAQEQYWSFKFPNQSSLKNAELDLSYLNEDVAGQHGFIKRSRDGNHFVRGDGEAIRFWGVTPRREFVEMPMDSLRVMARFYAKMGINMVRIHAQISPKEKDSQITDVDRKEVDGIWKVVAAFKDEGIYLTISPYWPSEYYLRHISEEWGLDGNSSEEHIWNLLYFNEKLKSGYKSWIQTLYTETNPYTNIPLKDEPAVAIIQIQNEDGMLWWTVDQIKPAQKHILEKQFSRFISNKYGSCEEALQSWSGETVDGDQPYTAFVKLYPMWELTQDQEGGKAIRVKDQIEFLATLQYNFNKEITDYYRNELGCKQLINPNNWFPASITRLNDLERWTYSCAEVMAVNRYFSPDHVGENAGWRIDPGHYYVGKSVLHNPVELISNIKQPDGYPFIISEGGWNLPSQYLAEAPFLTAAYQSLTGVDGLFWYATTSTQFERNPYYSTMSLENGQISLRRWTISIPQLLGLFPANAMIFRRGYVQEGESVVREETNLKALFECRKPMITERSGFDPNRSHTKKLQDNSEGMTINPLAFAVGPIQIDLDGTPGHYQIHPDIDQYIDMDNQIVTSITEELQWDYGKGIVTLNTDRAQGVCGFNIGRIDLKDASIECDNKFSSIQIVAMDDLKLSESRKILIQIGTQAKPTGWQEEPIEFESNEKKVQGFRILDIGKMPWQIESAKININLRNSHLNKAISLDEGLAKLKTIQLKKSGDAIAFTVPTNSMYVIVSHDRR